jgi:hypothetical protein
MRRPSCWCLTFSLAFSVAPPALAQTRAGGEVRVNTYTTGIQGESSLSADARGNFVVVWLDYEGIRGQLFDRAGARRGAEFRVEDNSAFPASRPAVAMNAQGGFLVVWDRGSGTGDIFGQLFDSAANRLGAELEIQVDPAQVDGSPTLAADGQGNFVVVWRSGDGSGSGIAARRVSAHGVPLGAAFVVNTYTTDNPDFFGVSADAAGNFVVAWTEPGSGEVGDEVIAQRFAAGGARQGGNFVVNSITPGHQRSPGLAHAPDGSFVIAFSSTPYLSGDMIVAKRYSAAGAPIGSEFQVNNYTSGPQGYPQVRMDALGGYVIAWNDFAGSDGDFYGVKARRYYASGTARGGDFTVNTYTTHGQLLSRTAPALGSDAAGNFVIAWDSAFGSDNDLDVYLQRYGGLHPDALVVDSAGNRVWEPGETVDVRPRWLNLNGAAQTIGGFMPGLFGPPGATYTITDGQAFYSTIPNGASAACVECYSVAVNDAVPRPAAHWDTQAFELLVPDTQGQVKSWTLHLGRSFTDVAITSAFYPFIETLLHRGVTAGCGGGSYCTAASTTREQMAVFLLVSKDGPGYVPPACTTPVFGDVPASSPFCRWVEELARRGVTGGCAPNLYCPTAAVTREQMAVFLLRTLDPTLTPPACAPPNIFNDVPETSLFCRWIEELARRGITGGCGGGNFCPTQPVTREQMAVFLTGTFGLTLYGP